MSRPSVLISGAGIAGPALGFWLVRAGVKVTIVERASALRDSGQSIDIRGQGIAIIQRMGLEDAVRSKSTNERGIRFVDKRGDIKAEFPVSDGQGFTSEVEIMRGDLSNLLYEATKDDVEYIFGDTIKGFQETSTGITIEFSKGTPSRTFDILVGADGWASATRGLAFEPSVHSSCIRSLGQWGSWFSLPWSSTDSNWARWYNATGSRMILLRPDNEKVVRASIWIMKPDEEMKKILRTDVAGQKQAMKELFKDAGWETERVCDGMMRADDFYIQQIAQVRMPSLSKGRVVLVGDSGYCPTPISGVGTTAALLGAYILGGEIAKHSGQKDYKAAFDAYEEKMRPFITTAQKLIPGAPRIANPQTQWGIWVLHMFLGFIAWSGVFKLFNAAPASKAIELPQYQFESRK